MMSTFLAYLDLDVNPSNSIFILKYALDESNQSVCNDLEALGTVFKSNLYEKLYNDAEEIRSKKALFASDYHNKIKDKTSKEFTGKPHILDISKRIAAANRKAGFIENSEQWQANRNAKINARIHEKIVSESKLMIPAKATVTSNCSNSIISCSKTVDVHDVSEEYSHRPSITKLAKNIGRNGKVEDRLIKEGQKSKMHIDSLRMHQNTNYNAKCSNVDHASEAFDRLYMNALELKVKQLKKISQKEYSFMPKLNTKFKDVARKDLYFVPEKKVEPVKESKKLTNYELTQFIQRNYKICKPIKKYEEEEKEDVYQLRPNKKETRSDPLLFDRLYNNAKLLQETKKQKAIEEAANKAKEEYLHCTFTPILYSKHTPAKPKASAIKSPNSYIYNFTKQSHIKQKQLTIAKRAHLPHNKSTIELDKLADQLHKIADQPSQSPSKDYTMLSKSFGYKIENDNTDDQLSLSIECC